MEAQEMGGIGNKVEDIGGRIEGRVYPLSINKCIQLANYFFGYNGWSSKVIKCVEKEIVKEVSEGKKEKWKSTFEAIVCIQLKDGRRVEAMEEGSKEDSDKYNSIHLSKKVAVTNALLKAFSMIVIVSLSSSKVTAHLLFDDPLTVWS